jgi:hypothetical protein
MYPQVTICNNTIEMVCLTDADKLWLTKLKFSIKYTLI